MIKIEGHTQISEVTAFRSVVPSGERIYALPVTVQLAASVDPRFMNTFIHQNGRKTDRQQTKQKKHAHATLLV